MMRYLIITALIFFAGCSSAKLMKNCEHLGKQIYRCEDL